MQVLSTYQILEDFVLIAVLRARLSCEPLVLILRGYEAIMTPVTVIESKLLLFSCLLKSRTNQGRTNVSQHQNSTEKEMEINCTMSLCGSVGVASLYQKLTGLVMKVSPSSMRMIDFELAAFSRSLNGRTRTATFTLVISLSLAVGELLLCPGFLLSCGRIQNG